eukprot:SAG22_NODE_230_length_14595_cov_50.767660_18_plen_66_part_00
MSVAADNQAVVRESDTVFLALRPGDAAAALQGLHFGPDVLVVSLMHGISPRRPSRGPPAAWMLAR